MAFEPAHGRLSRRHPWKLYGELADALKSLAYDVIALEGCISAKIQAPAYLRAAVRGELESIGNNCAA